MCGIVGVISGCNNGFSTTEASVFSDLLYLDALRGMDSTGVFSVDKHSNVDILKEATMSPLFMKTPEYTKFRQQLVWKGLFAVGHNRAATKGSVKDENAHPFWVDNKIVLVQNGTYRGDHKHLKDTEVDTEAIAHVIAEEDDVEKALQKINSAYALVWFNTKTNTLYLIRNHERPLHIAYQKNGRGIFFASEKNMLDWALARNDIKTDKDPYMLKEGHLYKIEIDGSSYKAEGVDIDHKYRFPYQAQNNQRAAREIVSNVGAHPFRWRHRFWTDDDQDDAVLAKTTQRIGGQENASGPALDKADAFVYSFSDIAGSKLSDDWASETEIHAASQDFINRMNAAKQGRIPVELMDFEPINNNPNCCKWHVWGYMITPEASPYSANVMVHWIVENKTMTEIDAYVKNYMYTVKPSSVVTRRVYDGHVPKNYATCYATQVEAVPLVNTTAAH